MLDTRREQPPHKHLGTNAFLYPEHHGPASLAPAQRLPASPWHRTRQNGFKVEALVALQHFLHI